MLRRFAQIAGDPASIRARVLGAGLWTAAQLAAQYPLRLLSNLIMTRLLAPDDFGLIATVVLVQMFTGLISDVGIGQSVIRSPRGEEPAFLRTAWTMQLIRAGVIGAILIGLALAVATLGPALAVPGTVYADDRLALLLAALVLVTVANGATSANFHLATRRLQQRQISIIMVVAHLASLVIMVTLGLTVGTVWSLFSGMLGFAVLRSALCHLMLDGPSMRLAWDRAAAAEIWSFGKWLIPATGGRFLNRRSVAIVFSATADASLFGLISVAQIWSNMTVEPATRLMQPVLLPAISELRRVRAGGAMTGPLIKLLAITAAIACTGTAAMLVFAAYIMQHLYVPPFDDARVFVAILASAGLTTVFRPVGQLLLSAGLSRIMGTANIVAGVASVAIVYAALDALGVAAALTASVLCQLLPLVPLLLHPETGRHLDRRVLLAMLAVIAGVTVAIAWAAAPAVQAVVQDFAG